MPTRVILAKLSGPNPTLSTLSLETMTISKETIKLIEQELAERFADDVYEQLKNLHQEGNFETFGLTEDEFDELRASYEGGYVKVALTFAD